MWEHLVVKQVATKATMVMRAAARVARPVRAAKAVRAAAMRRGGVCVEASREQCVEAKEKQQLGLPKERMQPREEGS